MTTERRRFLRRAALSVLSARFGLLGDAAQRQRATSPGAPLGPILQLKAGVLEVGYVDIGPRMGRVVLLLHGWPYDIQSYAEVAPALAARGFRVIVPFLRGFGSTRFLSRQTMRNGEQAAFAVDAIALLDALQVQQAIVGGFDWGARTANILAALWRERCRAIVSVSGYLIVNREANREPLAPRAELGWWYQYYFATERGRRGYEQHTREFNRLIWQLASPSWHFDDATFDRTAAAFDNPDHVAIVIHNYRWRLELADGEPQYDEMEHRLEARPAIMVPAITIGSDFDGPAADGQMYTSLFAGKHEHRVLRGIGHNVPQEAPQAFVQAIVDVDRF